MTLRQRLAQLLFGDLIRSQAKVLASVTVKVDDSPGWVGLSGAGPQDRPWPELYADLTDALEAWRKNFMIRRIVTLTRSYVCGGGIQFDSSLPDVDKFIRNFWNHPKNRLPRRLGPMCDELSRAGELFVTLHTNKIDGTSYIRFVPATCIDQIESAPNDYERELKFHELRLGVANHRWWMSTEHPEADQVGPPDGQLPPVMLHYAVNRPVGATRGEGDLGPVLKWALRYTNWLEDRVRLNRVRTRQGLLDVTLSDDSMVETKRQQLVQDNPIESGIYVHGQGETVTMNNLNVDAKDAADDGKSLRLAVATGANTALHYMGEGEGTNYASAREMGEPTARFYAERQQEFLDILSDLITVAWHRMVTVTSHRDHADLKLRPLVTEVARADNSSLAQAAFSIVQALATMKAQGWIDDPTAIRLAFKFAGELIAEEDIKKILAQPKQTPPDGGAKPEPKKPPAEEKPNG